MAMPFQGVMQMPDESGAHVTVTEAQGEVEAQLVRGLLESRGIRTILRGEALRNVHGFTLDGLGRVEIQVAPADAERARALIADLESGRVRLEDDDPGAP